MTALTESGQIVVKLVLGLSGAGVAAVGAVLAQSLDSGAAKTLMENGLAGMFILFLIGCLKILWDARKAEAVAAVVRQDLLANRLSALEKEVRDELRGDLRAAQESRAEMIQVLKHKFP